MKTPQELQSIFNKFPKEKIELKAEKIELGIIQDIIQVFKKGRGQFMAAASMEDKAMEEYSNSLKTLLQAQKLSEKAKSDAKTLGVEIPKETQSIFNLINEFTKEAQNKK